LSIADKVAEAARFSPHTSSRRDGRLRDFGGGRFEQNLAAETHGAPREIPVIRAGLRGKSVHERTSVEIVPRLLQVLEAEPIQQPELWIVDATAEVRVSTNLLTGVCRP
jgi:hypothetical protein